MTRCSSLRSPPSRRNPLSEPVSQRALRQVSGPPGVSIRPGEWAKAKALIGQGVAVNYHGASDEVDFGSSGDVSALFDAYTIGSDGDWERVGVQ